MKHGDVGLVTTSCVVWSTAPDQMGRRMGQLSDRAGEIIIFLDFHVPGVQCCWYVKVCSRLGVGWVPVPCVRNLDE